ncbi:MAG TPA: hypothetical protein IAC53_04185 [Candidatus Fimenecus excrementigallinarum]|uniref:Uncharacterized protein n=1 Tax=Candidatus Fimenecus excrementigallinarum TaxID=2840816 RepID=A0A9D1IFM4_9FIRM|nr:hypothetical protein [Candidatus Fimenecus excrementigallinarum]
MDVLLRDLRLLSAGTRLLKLLWALKTALTVGMIVFTVWEAGGALLAKKTAAALPQR